MTAVSLEDAQANLPQLIDQLAPGEALVILRMDRPIARLTAEPSAARPPRRLGSGKGKILYMAPDFDAPLEDFKEYME